ncbi:hypothetical protein ON010_g17498 [Phytophthora cinnamomi]|nr:hypothetical protein ON010_g17498 [Phytophthora cinnamomi]
MELPSLSIVNDEELMEEALAILDSVDIERLGASSSRACSSLPEASIEQDAAADDLLKTAIQAVHAAYPQQGGPQNDSKSYESKSQRHDEVEKTITPGAHDNSQQGTDPPKRTPLQIYTAVASTEKKTPRSRRSGGGRTRMREQLIQLRSVVQKMEHHLNTLRSPRSPRFRERIEDREAALAADENDSRGVNGAERTSESSGDAAVWRNIAMQQFRARRKAEQQNAKLRESLEAQIQLSKQVENLLEAHLKSIIP